MNILARKGSINLIKHESGLYTVDKITKAVGMSYAASYDKIEAVNAFRDHAQKTRRNRKTDFNLELYGL